MKKLIGTLVAALLAAAVFAEVNVGMGFSRGLWEPFLYSGKKVQMWEGVSWGGNDARVGASLSASSDNMGVVADITAENMGAGDCAYIWAQPWSWLKLAIGRYQDNTLRGSICFGSYDWNRPLANAWTGDDFTFYRLGKTLNDDNDQLVGAALTLTPVDGLYITAGFDLPGAARETKMAGIQVQVGYTIADLMAIKVQYMRDKDNKNDALNAAIDLLMIENNTISVGAIIPFNTNAENNIIIRASYAGGFDAVSLGAYAGVTLGNDKTTTKDPVLEFGLGLGFDLGNGLGLSIDVRPTIALGDKVATTIGAGVYLDKGLSNGSIGIGIGTNFKIQDGTEVADTFEIGIPIRMQCFF